MTELPKPDAQSAAHSARVTQHLHERIDATGGCISFASFMQEALYAQGLGYYAAGSTKLGASGDFVTAPEISTLFGAVVARQCAGILEQLDAGTIIELGAGSGKLARDVLSKLARLGQLPEHYQILEISADLAERQRNLLREELPDLADRVEWIDALPSSFEGVVIANEVVDAIPAERFVIRDGNVWQQCVVRSTDGFAWSEITAPQRLTAAVRGIENDIGYSLPDGYCSEVSLALTDWLGDLRRGLSRGAMLFFDYGVSRREYYAPDRNTGWLRCYFRHCAHDNPLVLAGIQDITTWVDFSHLAGSAVTHDLDILGYVTQNQFLMGGGLEEEMGLMTNQSAATQLAVSAALKRLTMPGEMGENFKCLGLGAGDISVPTAFGYADRTRTL